MCEKEKKFPSQRQEWTLIADCKKCTHNQVEERTSLINDLTEIRKTEGI